MDSVVKYRTSVIAEAALLDLEFKLKRIMDTAILVSDTCPDSEELIEEALVAEDNYSRCKKERKRVSRLCPTKFIWVKVDYGLYGQEAPEKSTRRGEYKSVP